MDATPIIPTDEPSIFAVLDSLTTLERRAIVRPQNPPPGIAGYLFDIPQEEELRLRSLITDNFVEDNSAVTDQIALAPEEYVIRGLVAELAAINPTADAVAKIGDALPDDPNITPELTDYQLQELNDPEVQTTATDLYALFGNLAAAPPNQTKQARVLAYFYQLWHGRQLVTVETAWGFLTNMALLDVRAAQPGDTRFESSFTIVFKKIRTARPATVSAGQLAGRASAQMAPTTENGTAGQTPVAPAAKESLLHRFANPSP